MSARDVPTFVGDGAGEGHTYEPQTGGVPPIQGLTQPDPRAWWHDLWVDPVAVRTTALHEAVILGSRLGMEESRVLDIAGEFAEFLFGPDPDADQ